MTDVQQVQTEEQTNKINDAQTKIWESDFKEEDIIVPYKQGDKSDGQTDPSESPAESPDDKGEANETEVERYAPPEPLVTMEDPGEYVPKDYSFEIEIDGKTHKVTTAEQAADIADEYAEKLSAKKLVTLINKGSQIANKQERDKSDWQNNKDLFTAQTEAQNSRQATIDKFTNEMQYLQDKGKMPKVDDKYKDADWFDPEIAKDPAINEFHKLSAYMAQENEARTKAGISPLTSMIDAFNAWKADGGGTEIEQRKVEGEKRRAAGARVAGVSASNQAPYVPAGIAVGNPNAFKNAADIWKD